MDIKMELDLSSINDLILLPSLNEDVILDVLYERYSVSEIYTNTDSVLLAVNPFKSIPLYTNEIMKLYRERDINVIKELPPHPWKTAAKCCAQTTKDSMFNRKFSDKNESFFSCQSILISGESGAGKTETTKVIMQYLASLSSQIDNQNKNNPREGIISSHKLGMVQEQVLNSNPIIEAYGNARTVRNDNSSRFGKYIKLLYSDTNELQGISLNTFLLEMPRLITQSHNERNFHIFYLLFNNTNENLMNKLYLKDITTYHYLNQSNCYIRHDGIQDSDKYNELLSSFHILGFNEDNINNLFCITIAILNIGNILFSSESIPSGEMMTNPTVESLEYVQITSKLLEINEGALISILVSRDIIVAGEILRMTLDAEQSIHMRDSLSKSIYLALFNWILDFINNNSIDLKFTNNIAYFIGILDIFGFESLEYNSYEQLLINYANECLQQQFNSFMIENEQKLYIDEGITWNFITFPSNRDCIDLIAERKLSILTILHEASIVPSGNDSSFVNRVYTIFANHNRLELTSYGKARSQFSIKHFAGIVCYNAIDFVNKNKGKSCPFNLIFSQSSNEFIRNLGEKYDATQNFHNSKNNKKEIHNNHNNKKNSSSNNNINPTIAISFKENLNDLLNTIASTGVHYIRCFKPNSENIQNNFNRERMCEQLQSSGIIQTISVIRAGFPYRFSQEKFCMIYKSILPYISNEEKVGSVYDKSIGIIIYLAHEMNLNNNSNNSNNNNDNDYTSTTGNSSSSNQYDNFDEIQISLGVQVGKTMVFIRQQAFAAIESLRHKCEYESILQIQKIYRCYIAFKRFKIQYKAIISIQSIIKMFLLRRRFKIQCKIALTIQIHWRRRYAQKKLLEAYNAIRTIQSLWIVSLCRNRLKKVMKNKLEKRSILKIETWWKIRQFVYCIKTRCEARKVRRATVLIQSHWRRWLVAMSHHNTYASNGGNSGDNNSGGTSGNGSGNSGKDETVRRISRWLKDATQSRRSWDRKRPAIDRDRDRDRDSNNNNNNNNNNDKEKDKERMSIKPTVSTTTATSAITSSPTLIIPSPSSSSYHNLKIRKKLRGSSGTVDIVVPQSIPDETQRLLHANRHVLWDIAIFYSPNRLELPSPSAVAPGEGFASSLVYFSPDSSSSHTNTATNTHTTSTGTGTGTATATSGLHKSFSKNSLTAKIPIHIAILPADSVCTLAKDWNICPGLCGKSILMDMIIAILDSQEWDWEESKISFSQFMKLLYMISIRLEGLPKNISEEDRMKFVLRVMNTSEGRKKRLQYRSANLLLRFVNIESLKSIASPAKPMVLNIDTKTNMKNNINGNGSSINSSLNTLINLNYSNNNNNKEDIRNDNRNSNRYNYNNNNNNRKNRSDSSHSRTSDNNNGSSSKPDMNSLPKILMLNEAILLVIFNGYSRAVGAFRRSTSRPRNNERMAAENDRDSRDSRDRDRDHMREQCLSKDAIWNMFRDFNISPTICSKSALMSAIEDIGSDNSYGLSFPDFLQLIMRIARDKVQMLGVEGPSSDRRLNALFATMDNSQGRAKFLQIARNASVLPPFTLLEDSSFITSSSGLGCNTEFDSIRPAATESSEQGHGHGHGGSSRHGTPTKHRRSMGNNGNVTGTGGGGGGAGNRASIGTTSKRDVTPKRRGAAAGGPGGNMETKK